MILWFTVIQLVVAIAAGLLCVVLGLIGRKPSDLTLGSMVLIELLLVVQVVVAIVAPFVGNEPTGNPLEYWLYLIGALIIPPLAVIWAFVERNRWSTVILGVGARLYMTSADMVKVFIEPAVAYEFEGGRGTPAWQHPDIEYSKDLVFHHAAHQGREEGFVSRGEGRIATLGVAVEAMFAELADHRLHADAGHFHLVEGLNGGQPRHRAGLLGQVAHRWPVISCCRSATMVTAARAAPPPLSPSLARARAQA